jgi:hypothetical protein
MFAPGSWLRVGGPEDGLAPDFFVEGGAWRTSSCRFLSSGYVKAALMGKEVVSGNIGALISLLPKPEEFGSKDCEVLSLDEKEGGQY